MGFNYSLSLLKDRIKVLEKEIKEIEDWLDKNSKNPNYYINHECDVACCLLLMIGEKNELIEALEVLKNKNNEIEKTNFQHIPVWEIEIK